MKSISEQLNNGDAVPQIVIKQPFVVHNDCGHRFDPRYQPRHNCEYCWDFYFKAHPGYISAWKSAISALGKQALIAQEGNKLVKQFSRFTEEEQR